MAGAFFLAIYATLVVMFKPLFLLFAFCFLPITPSFAHGSFVYVTNYGDGTVSQFRAASDGSLTPLNPPTVKAWPRCHSLVTNPTGRYLYVLSSLDFSRRNCLISQYRVGGDGRLRSLFPLHVVLPSGAAPYLLFTEPTGHFLYVLERGGMLICLRVGTDGALKLLDLPVQDVGLRGSFGYSVAFDRAHSTFYSLGETRMTNAFLGWLVAFHVTKNGILHSATPLLPKNKTQKVEDYDQSNYSLQAVTANQGRWVYLLYDWYSSDEPGPVLMQYKTHKGGLVPLTPPRVPLVPAPQEAASDPFGDYLYVMAAQKRSESDPVTKNMTILARYKIGRSGALGQFRQQTLPASSSLFSPVFDPSGRFLYLLTGNGVRPFRTHADGAVFPLGMRSIHAGREPLEMIYVEN